MHTISVDAVASQRHINPLDSTVLALSARNPAMARAYQFLAGNATKSAVPSAVRALGQGSAGCHSALAALAS